ncbi:MAG TPA: MFS transporter [Candidatus Sulfotelmatobacter sp.]|nr:MFS transporter [Candidatus Sulfotelmatobacter sp.]
MNENLILKTLRIKPFSFLLLSEFFSIFAMNLLNFALLIVVFSISKSNTAVAGVVMAFTIPNVLFGILAGVMVDRWNKKTVLFMTNISRALLVLPLAFFHTNLAVVYFFTFCISVIMQFFIPAETPIIPLLVRKDLLLSANALFGMGIYASILLAYAFSGPALYLLGKSDIFLFLSMLFIVAGFFTYLIKANKSKIEPKKSEDRVLGFREESKIVFQLISKTKNLYHALFSLTLAQIIILLFAAIGPGYAAQVLKIRIESFPILFVTPAIMGIVLGAIIIGSYLHKVSKAKLTKFGLFLMGTSILFLPYGSKVESRAFVHLINSSLPHILMINVLHIMVVLAFVLGFAIAFVFIPANTILQEETSDESRGKIYGFLNTFVGIMSIIPVVLVGGLADLFGVKFIVTVIGVIVLAIAFIRALVTDR